jgi:hypothetical protein
MRSSGKRRRLSKSTIRLLILAWIGVGVLMAVCVFVGVLLLLPENTGGTVGERPTRTPRPGVAVTTPTAIGGAAQGGEQGGGAQGGGGAEPGPGPTQGLADDGKFALGGQIQPYHVIAHEELMRSAGMSWIKFQIVWTPGALAREARDLIIFGHQKNFKVLVSVKGPAYPNSIDYADYTRFLKALVSDKPDAIEIWNEMNLPIEWPAGKFSASDYVNNMLKPAYETIKAKSPETMVITGALAPTGVDDGVNAMSDSKYVQAMAAAGAAQYADCVGVHHNSGTTSPSARSGHVSDQGDNHYSWYFLPTLEVYYNGFGSQKPLCLTEFGYLSPDGYGQLPSAFAWGAGTSVDEQAAWLSEGAKLAKQLGYVRLMIIWNVDFPADDYGTDPKAGFGIVRPDGKCPACTALWSAMTGQ